MKNIILLFMLFFTIGVTYAQDSTQYVTNSNAEKLIDKYSAKVENAIIALAEKLQQPVEHVYKVLVRQQLVWGIGTLLGICIGFSFILLGIIVLNKWDWDEDIAIFMQITGYIITVISLILFFIYGLTGLINPEYGALKDIISMIK